MTYRGRLAMGATTCAMGMVALTGTSGAITACQMAKDKVTADKAALNTAISAYTTASILHAFGGPAPSKAGINAASATLQADSAAEAPACAF